LKEKLGELHKMLTTVTGLAIDGVVKLDGVSYQVFAISPIGRRGVFRSPATRRSTRR
jgi:hypothetical protein